MRNWTPELEHEWNCTPTQRELLEDDAEGRELIRRVESQRAELECTPWGRRLLQRVELVPCPRCGVIPKPRNVLDVEASS